LTLTPAYDICPQGRAGNEASQAMLIYGDRRLSRIDTCLEAAHHFLLSRDEARAIYEKQKALIEANWETVCGEAGLDETNRRLLFGRQFLNPFSLENVYKQGEPK
jgi:serine/threonine-protein kinase HipA